MARIPEAEIERLKTEISVERLVEASGIMLKKSGKDQIGKCPFHEDAEPSLVVTAAKNLWHCFGCQTGGGPIDWVMKMQGVSFRHAVELLREGIPPLAAAAAGAVTPVKQSTVRKLPPPVAPDAGDTELLQQVMGYYHETLKQSPEALAYLQARGLTHPKVIERFKLGFANRTLGLRLPEKNRVAGAAMRTRLQKLGILRESGHEHFNGSLVIPVLDEAGNVSEIYGRKIRDDLRPGTPPHLYLPGPHRGVWNVEALAASKEIILCEALIDALTFWCAGYCNVTSAYGVEGFTDDHLVALKRYGVERVLIAYDRDDAGERAADKLAARLMAEGIECYRIQFPHGMDANEYAVKVTPAPKSLGVAIRKAVWLGKGDAPARAQATVAVDAPVPPPPVVAASEKDSLQKLEEPAAEPLPASPVPPASAPEVDAQVSDAEIVLTFGERRYRVRGLAKNLSYELLKVNLLAARGESFYVDTVDLYSAKQRASYVTQAAIELQLKEDIIKVDVGRVLLKLEALQEEAIRKALQPKMPEAVAIPEAERAQALELLKSPDLIPRILADLEACGLVGEHTNKLVAYLAATSRKLDAPLAVLVQSSSAAGKSALMDAILALMPEEDRVKYSAMTGQSLFYIGNGNLKHKILAIAEEEGASRASYALKLLHSEGELIMASTGKDPATGNLVTQEYRVEGPTMIFTTTTAIDVDAELQNRCLVLSVDESRGQTQAIHTLQRARRTLAGLVRKARRTDIQKLHKNAQRLLRPLEILNPYAERLTFPDAATRTRRDHEKYLTLIDTIALVHQHQRAIKTTLRDGQAVEYIEATLDDIALANELAHEVLGRSLDELPPQTRRVLALMDAYVASECKRQSMERTAFHFSRRALREATEIGDTQLRLHLDRLVSLEYLIVHRGARGQSFVYELVYDGQGQDGKPFVPGLIEIASLCDAKSTPTTANLAGVNGEFAGPTRGQSGPNAGGSRPARNSENTIKTNTYDNSSLKPQKTHSTGGNGQDRSYPQAVVPLAAAAAGAGR
jgi:DNA primase catalytic core